MEEKCFAEQYCKGFPDKCHQFCPAFNQLKFIYNHSNMPEKYKYHMSLMAKNDTKAYYYLKNWMENIIDNIENGRGLFLWSQTKGNGKTAWACKIMNYYFRLIARTTMSPYRGLFVSVPRFMREIRNNIKNPDSRFMELCKRIEQVDIVVWDDIGCERDTDYVREMLFTYIDSRVGDGLTNIYTSNHKIEELEDEALLGERIVSRILGQCDLVQFVNADQRKAVVKRV